MERALEELGDANQQQWEENQRLREALEAVYSFKDDWYATVCEAIQESGDE